MVKLKEVQSSQVRALGHDLASRTLAVVYSGGGGTIYHYRDVPPEVAEQVLSAESIGRALNQHIRGKYDFDAVAGDDAPLQTLDGATVDPATAWPVGVKPSDLVHADSEGGEA